MLYSFLEGATGQLLTGQDTESIKFLESMCSLTQTETESEYGSKLLRRKNHSTVGTKLPSLEIDIDDCGMRIHGSSSFPFEKRSSELPAAALQCPLYRIQFLHAGGLVSIGVRC